MTANSLNSGAAAMYEKTTSRWFIAVVREVRGDNVEIEYVTGRRETVPAEKVRDFVT